MAILTDSYIFDFLLLTASFLIFSYLKFRLHSKNYWKRRNVPYLEPSFLLGNTAEISITKSMVDKVTEIYNENKQHKLFGMWLYTRPVLIVQDLGLIKNVLVKDFQFFHDRGIVFNEEKDPLNAHLVMISGSKWRNLRTKLSPAFTSGKMKMMYPTMVNCGKELQEFLETFAKDKQVIETRDILSSFTTDIISSVAFGIESNSLKNPNSEFRTYGRKIFRPSVKTIISSFLLFLCPGLDNYLPLKRTDEDVEKFYLNLVKETIEYREKNDVKRNDFMDILIQLKNKGYVEDADFKADKVSDGDPFTWKQAAAQAFVFFAAGFDTSSSTMTFALYELAKNPDCQKKLQNEIDSVTKKCNNEITYEAIQEMQYLNAVINEALRMYPPAGDLMRECSKKYIFPETGVTIDKGTTVIIPVRGIQNDPQYFPDPDVFRPERFLPDEKSKRDNFLHLSFGEGPRMCIGNRFGLLQSKIGLFYILSKYEVQFSEITPVRFEYDPRSFLPAPKGSLPLRLCQRRT